MIHVSLLLGMIGIGEPNSLREASAALSAFHVPVVSVSPGVYSSSLPSSANTLTTAPDMAGQARVSRMQYYVVLSIML